MMKQTWKGLALTALMALASQAWGSEPSSLYMRCTLTSQQYDKAMAAPPGSARTYNDWQTWFDGQGMYGPGKVQAEWLRASEAESLEALLQAWEGAGGLSHYDPSTGRWQFALLEFTENYGEMIQLLAPLRSVAPYCKADSDSFVLIYSYIWGDGDNAYLTLNQRQSRFAEKPTPAQREEADAALKVLMDKASER